MNIKDILNDVLDDINNKGTDEKNKIISSLSPSVYPNRLDTLFITNKQAGLIELNNNSNNLIDTSFFKNYARDSLGFKEREIILTKSYGSEDVINAQDTHENTEFFILKKDDKHSSLIKYKSGVIGTLVVPFKYRFGNNRRSYVNETTSEKVIGTVESKINIGGYIGIRFGKIGYPLTMNNQTFSTFGLFLAPQSISISESNTRHDRINLNRKEYTAFGSTIGLTYIFTYKQLNTAVLGGFDFAHGKAAGSWVYQSKYWFGFGIGYKLGIFNN